MTARAYGYVMRDGRVAVFEHADADAGLQVPGGGVERGESPVAAVVREVQEESGLRCAVVADLGVTHRRGWFPDVGDVEMERHFFHLRPIGSVRDTWTWVEHHASDGGGPYEFAYRWLPLAEAVDALDVGFGDMLGALGAPADGVEAASLVRAGYDRLATSYPAWSRHHDERNVRHDLIDRALGIGASGPALDIGCGTGQLATARLAERGLDVVGVDLSPVSIALASTAIPGGMFLAADITALSLPLRHFGLVTAFNSVIHVPRSRHAALFRDVHRWLRPGGVFVLNVETDGASGAGRTEAWLDGVEMFWSGWTAAEEIALLDRAGLSVVDVVDQGTGTEWFTWLVCRRQA